MLNLLVGTIVMKDRATVLLAKAAEGPDAGLWTIPDGFIADGEAVRETSIRVLKEELGMDVEPQTSLFLCQRIVKDEKTGKLTDHRVGYFVLALFNDPELTPSARSLRYPHSGTRYSEAKWVDVRTLGEIQKNEGRSDFTADAFVKFSNFLRSQAAAIPHSGDVN